MVWDEGRLGLLGGRWTVDEQRCFHHRTVVLGIIIEMLKQVQTDCKVSERS